MAIEIPNYVHAAAFIVPTFATDYDPPQPTPFFMNEGFQQYDPDTSDADPIGGYTDLLPGLGGLWALKMQQGIDTLEGIVQCTMLAADKQGTGLIIPVLPEFVLGDSLADGFTILATQIKVTDPEGIGNDPFSCTVWRVSTNQITQEQFEGTQP